MTSDSENFNPPLRLLAAFQQAFPDQNPVHILKAPGREMWVAAGDVAGTSYTLVAPDLDGRVNFSRRTAKVKRTLLNRPLPRWSRYPAGVILALCDEGVDVNGISAVIVGEETQGPRYDHALGMTIAALWYHLNDLEFTTAHLIEVVKQVQHDYLSG